MHRIVTRRQLELDHRSADVAGLLLVGHVFIAGAVAHYDHTLAQIPIDLRAD